MASEERLIDRCRAGDTACYGELARLHQDKVFSMLYYLLGDYYDAQDATQETFLKAFRSLDKFRGDCGFSTWLHRIAINTARSMGRKHQSGPKLIPLEARPGDDHSREERPAEDGNPVEAASLAEEREIVRDALSKLSFDHRRLVVLHDIEGRNYAEIAEMLECPRGTVKSGLHRARTLLRGEVEKRVKSLRMDAAESGAG